MSSGILVRQSLTRGESHRAASVLTRMQEEEGVSVVLSRLGLYLAGAALGRSRDGPYVYYRMEPGGEGGLVGRYEAVVDAAADETDAVAEVVTAFDRLTEGAPESAEFRSPSADTGTEQSSADEPSDSSRTAED